MSILTRNNVQVRGDGAPVILYAHGFGCSQSMWCKITPAFEATHQQILFDYVGSGKSEVKAFDDKRYASLDGYVQDVLEICDALGLKKDIIFVGHSVSAAIGLLASIARPELFSQLILIGPSPCFLNDPPNYMGGFERQDLEGLLSLMEQNYIGWANYLAPIIAGGDDPQGVSGELSDSFCSTDPLVARTFARATFFADNRKDLPLVTCPSLILQHNQDALVPLPVGEYLHAQLKNSTLKVLDVAGHCCHMSHPELAIAAMREYLSKPLPSPSGIC